MHKLMTLIYNEKQVPEQWLVAKTIPVFKNKGNEKTSKTIVPLQTCALYKGI
jgi:hypothetical protein